MRFSTDLAFKLWVRQFGALALIPLDKIMEAWSIIIDTIPGELNSQLIKFLNYFISTWIIGKQGSTLTPKVWNLFDLEGDRTNNVMEGGHSSSNRQLKPHSDIYKVINFFKITESENTNMYLRYQQGNENIKTTKSLKDRQKEDNLKRIQESFQSNEITFSEYFNQLSYQVTFPYGENDSELEFDRDDDNENEVANDCEDTDDNKQSNCKKVQIDNPFKKSDFFADKLIKKQQQLQQEALQQNKESSLKQQDQNHLEQLITSNKQEEIRPQLQSSIIHTIKTEKSVIKINSKRKTSVGIENAQPESRSKRKYNKKTVSQHIAGNSKCQTTSDDCIAVLSVGENLTPRNIKVKYTEWIINQNEWLTNGHIDAFQNLLADKYSRQGFNGFVHPAKFISMKNDFYLNPETIHDSPFVTILSASDHWITLTNYNPFYNEKINDCGLGVWFVYDSLNDPENYLKIVAPALKRLNMDSGSVRVLGCNMPQQYGTSDCGLFALAYAIAICENKEPDKLILHQISMRDRYNSIQNRTVTTI